MVKTVTPFSTRAKEGATDSPLGDFVEVPQTITSTANAGFYDTTGKLRGVQSSDKLFLIDPIHESVANNATILSPQLSDHEYIDMTGFNDLYIGLKVTNTGNFAIDAVMGPSTYTFANLSPINPTAVLRGASQPANSTADIQPLLEDAAQHITADVWNIFVLHSLLANQKLLQFKIVNNSGDISDIQFASMRVV
jgi:hypothetical protein